MTFLVLDSGKGTLKSLERRLDRDGFSFGYDGDFSDIKAIVMDPLVFINDVEKRIYLKKYANLVSEQNDNIPIFIYSNYLKKGIDNIGLDYFEYFRKSDGNSIDFLVKALKPFLGIGNSVEPKSPDGEPKPYAV